MKENEKIKLIARVYLDLMGPSTSNEIIKYIETGNISIRTYLNPQKFAGLVRGSTHIKKVDGEGKKYCVVK